MLPHYIIDGYNLLHEIPSLKKLLDRDATAARERLVDAVARLTMKKKFRCTIVFDGTKPHDVSFSTSNTPIHVVYSFPVSADEKIRDMIEKSKSRTLLVIVSSDREILNFARVCSCTTHTSKYFKQMLFEEPDNGEEKDQVSLSKEQVREWLKIFGEGEK
ncbi:MAG: NYN domain-containing protein [Bacteroidota bacterium]|nr:NYN domain-containing protein [Bacteroidota bacterium]